VIKSKEINMIESILVKKEWFMTAKINVHIHKPTTRSLKKEVLEKLVDKLQSRLGDESATKGWSTKSSKGIQERSIRNFIHKSRIEEEKDHWEEFAFFQFCRGNFLSLSMMDECPMLHSKHVHIKS
jgi:hypothetical protein